jgi:hypothetical protein
MKKHRVLYNQDCTNLFAITKEPITPGHVDRMVDEVALGGADVMLINPNAQRVNYPSRVWQTFWDGYEPGKTAFFGPVNPEEIPGREKWVVQMKQLADQGCDYVERALARCRERGITPGISIRMNDMHDAPSPGTHLFGRFYMEHPECYLDNGPVCGWSAKGLNYEHPAVHEHFLALIRELVGRYDVEVLELDFLRFHCYFPRNDFARHAAIMTGFIRSVRQVLGASGRKVALMARVPASPAAAYELGFDVATWAREGLIDAVSAGGFLITQWALDVAGYRECVGERVAVYACTDYAADRRPDLPVRGLPVEPALLRGFAAAHLAAGADGVEMFNFFCAREQGWEKDPLEPAFPILRELGSLEGLRGVEKAYTVTSGWVQGEVDGCIQVPLVLETGRPRELRLLLSAEPFSATVQVSVLLSGSRVQAEAVWLQVNVTAIGPGREAVSYALKQGGLHELLFAVPAHALKDGCNRFVLRNEGEQVTLASLDVRVSG